MEYAPPRIFMDERVFSEILFDAMGTMEPRNLGILIGERYEVNNENFINIVSSVAIEQRGDPFPFLFREEDYLEANGSQKLTISQAVVVGWYRVGDTEGVSDDEVVNHRAYFKFPWQLMLKVDREKKEYSLYRPNDGAFELVDLLLYNDQFKGFFNAEPRAGEEATATSGLSEEYSGSIRRARRIINELESKLSKKDQELAEMRASVRSELASKMGRLERDLQEERDKIRSLRTIVLKEVHPPGTSPPQARTIQGRTSIAWGRKLVATAAGVGILMLAIGAILSQSPPALEGGIPTAHLAAVPEKQTPAAPAKTAPVSKKIEYKVKDGDTLWVISRKLLGDGSRFPEIVQENGLQGLKRLKPGTVLTITLDR